jgi:hypothetical protein
MKSLLRVCVTVVLKDVEIVRHSDQVWQWELRAATEVEK